MPEWLAESISLSSALPSEQMLVRLVVAALYGSVVAVIYRLSHGRQAERGEAWTLTTTLVLLAILIAMVSMVIGDNVARAFSLVGTLAIVRFRTVVEDTRDTAFVIYAVACGMCAGSGYYIGPLVAAPLVLGATLAFAGRRRKDRKAPPGRLVLRLSSAMNVEGALKTALDRHAPDHQLVGMATARGGHTATRLDDGRVLVVGGIDGRRALSTVEVFDPATGRVSAAAALPEPKATHGAARLTDGFTHRLAYGLTHRLGYRLTHRLADGFAQQLADRNIRREQFAVAARRQADAARQRVQESEQTDLCRRQSVVIDGRQRQAAAQSGAQERI